jgi:hypothetical protein
MKINREVYPAFTWLRENNDLFPREQHPDTRTAKEFFRDLKIKQIEKGYKKRAKSNLGPVPKPVICITTQQTFDGLVIASDYFGINRGQLSHHLNNPERYPNCYGMVFKWIK